MTSLFFDHHVEQLRQQDGVLTTDKLTIRIPHHFGFCGGVSHAIHILDQFLQTHKKDPNYPTFLLGEIIHNQTVNTYFEQKGVHILPESSWETLLPTIPNGSPIVFPAFGVPIETLTWLQQHCPQSPLIDTTCNYVRLISKFTQAKAKPDSTIIIHGKPNHPETIATISKIRHNFPQRCLVIIPSLKDWPQLEEAILTKEPPKKLMVLTPENFLKNDILLINQTTMLNQETQELGRRLQKILTQEQFVFHPITTICPATQQRQEAAQTCCEQPCDLILVIGGFTSSNTTQLFYFAQQKAPTYFIQTEADFSSQQITHWDPKTSQRKTTFAWLPENRPLTITLLAGASCPDGNIGHIIGKLCQMINRGNNDDASY